MRRILLGSSLLLLTATGCEVLEQVVEETVNNTINGERFSGNLVKNFNKKGPVSTTFDDAVYEVNALHDFEPNSAAYERLAIQPKSSDGSYLLKSGLYTMNARSFCLRGYTHGPSRGDGHLYAPLEGKKASFIEKILDRYSDNPEIPQQDIQVLLWAIIAGSDMNTLGTQYAGTLSKLFTAVELLEFQGRDWLTGMANEQISAFRTMAIQNVSPKLQKLLDADNTIRNMVSQNRSFQEIERVAVIAGVAPREDMIREVSKGRWSYHPDGYFLRFFPNGYPQTRIDVFVPLEGEVITGSRGKFRSFARENNQGIKSVTFKPSSMIAMPANQSSQRIGLSNLPVDDLDCLDAIGSWFYESPIENPVEAVSCSRSKVDWVYDSQIGTCDPFQGSEHEVIEYGNVYDRNSPNFHCYYVENTICDKAVCETCTEENVFNVLLQSANYAAPTDATSSVVDCSLNYVNIPCTFSNPIVTTVHPEAKAVVNYTVAYATPNSSIRSGPGLPTVTKHFLHPGKVQRKIFTEGTKIKMATLGEGSGLMPENNLIYALRTWGAVDNRLKSAFGCQ